MIKTRSRSNDSGFLNNRPRLNVNKAHIDSIFDNFYLQWRKDWKYKWVDVSCDLDWKGQRGMSAVCKMPGNFLSC